MVFEINPSLALERLDNFVLPFGLDAADVNGRFLRLGLPLDTVLNQHQYPPAVTRLLGEALLIIALIGSGLKGNQRVTLQAKGDGAIQLIVADYFKDGSVRGYADFDKERLTRWTEGKGGDQVDPFLFLGKGYLAITLQHDYDKQPYQGIVALDGVSLTAAIMKYMEQSDQLLSCIRLCLRQEAIIHDAGAANNNRAVQKWQGAAMILQTLGHSGDAAKLTDSDAEKQEKWNEAKLFFKTLSDDELLDKTLTPSRLLYRVFHEQGVRVYDSQPLQFGCTCSAEKIENVIKSSERDQVYDMVQDGKITATCQFCSAVYVFNPEDYGVEL